MAASKRRKRRPRKTRSAWWLAVPGVLGLLAGVLGTATVFRLLSAGPAHPRTLDPIRSKPADYSWAELPEPAFPIPPYARFLSDVCIVIDPGHVGQRDPGGTWKRGPTGLREADVNWRVALFLREFLDAAGARVILTRETEAGLDLPDKEDLRQRADVANRARADLLLSIHHNGLDDPKPNYTSVFYHSSPAHSRASACAARHVLTGLNDALRLETHLECAVLTDQVLYKNGLAVLREARVPAVLTEASFHSNPQEEARLRDPVYNRREAYGLFLGLARWAQAGLPGARLVKVGERNARGEPEAVLVLDDGFSARGGWGADQLRILPDSILVRLGEERLRHTLDLRTRELRVRLPNKGVRTGDVLFVDFETALGQHVLHPWIELGSGN